MTTVYVVFHNDIEDDKYVRAVCSTRERAEAITRSPEPCPGGHGWATRDGVDTGHRKTGVRRSPTDEWGCYAARDHFTNGGVEDSICCAVDEWTLDAVEPFVMLVHAATA